LIWLEKISKAIVDGGVRSFDTQALNIWSRGRGPLKRSSAIRTWRPEFFWSLPIARPRSWCKPQSHPVPTAPAKLLILGCGRGPCPWPAKRGTTPPD